MAKLQLRLPDSIHQKMKEIAQKENTSMNQMLVTSISNEIVRYETRQFFVERSSDFNEQDFLDALNEIPAIEPVERDKLD